MINALELIRAQQDSASEREHRRRLSDLAERKFSVEQTDIPLQREGMLLSNLAKRQALEQAPRTLARQEQQDAIKTQLLRDQIASRERIAGMRPRMGQKVVQTADGPMLLNPDGTASPIMSGGHAVRAPEKAEKPMTEFQGKSSLYGTRMQSSHDTLTPIEAETSQTGLAVKRSLQDMPLIGGVLGAAANLALSKEQQSIEQAQRDFINATLRQESGAVINPSEFENAQRQYFPQPGDNPALLTQKRKNREMAIAGFERMAGKEGGQAIRDVRNLRAESRGGTPGDGAGAGAGGNAFDAMPDPRQYEGKVITDTQTGTKWRATGGKWLRAQ